jgi:hypothetical protein
MGLTAQDIDLVARLVDGVPDARAAAPLLRSRLPQLRVSVQDASDLRETAPLLRTRCIDVHLMASDGHCWTLTSKPQAAAAIVLSDREPR